MNINKKVYIVFFFFVIQIICGGIIAEAFFLHAQENNSSYSLKPLATIENITINFTSNNYTLYGEIYYPSNATGTYPGIVCCEGFAGYVSAYNWIPKALAEQGYVAFIFDQPGQGFSEGDSPIRTHYFPFFNLLIRPSLFTETPIHFSKGEWITAAHDAITYLVEQSPVKQFVNTTCIGLIGHSLGGLTVTEIAANDTRVDAVVALSQGDPLSVPKLSVPIQFQGGDFDYSTHSVGILLSCYPKANTPKELVFIEHGTHFGFTTAFEMFCPCPQWQKNVSLQYAIGWFDYFLKHDIHAYEIITTNTDYLSKWIPSRYNFEGDDHVIK